MTLTFCNSSAACLRVCDSTLEVVTATSGEQALSELHDEVADLMLTRHRDARHERLGVVGTVGSR